ncbi:hypothetical protein DPMN_128573 [Dreissena polymorpha]|uniref:Netrin module non-TIMP type domain-containing protein n=1 Tax=Dreissena polymorpha TaxID=45954 RepID=A0A9D4H470_DREPO|nr:hypothetical protein DPMN_128573 [Dreissena polymorpha]
MKQVDQELFEMAIKRSSEKDAVKRQKLRSPVEALMDYACNFEKANFVVRVNVIKVGYDKERDVKFAQALIEETALQGSQLMREGDDMEFEWPLTCTQPELTVGKTYYIIAKKGTSFTEYYGMTRVRYQLTGTALVIDPEFKPLLRIMMNNFVKELRKNNGCIN